MILKCFLFFVLFAFGCSRTVKDDVNHLLTKNGRILIGVVQGNMEGVQLGINEGGSVNAMMEPYFGDLVLRLGKAYVSFPSCPAVHLCMNYGTKDHLNVAALLIKYGANANHYRLPTVSANGTVDLLDRGYPPALLFALGMGQIPQNTHAAMIQRMVRTNKNVFNLTSIEQWREDSGNPPLVQLCLLLDNVDGAHVLLSEFNMNVNEADADQVTALHIAAWRGNLAGMVMLLRQGANVFAEDSMGRTALHYIIMRGHTPTALKILLASALSDKARTTELQRRMLTHTDRNGRTVFDLAAAAPMKTELLVFLREQAQVLGVAPDAVAAQGEVAVDVFGEETESLSDLTASALSGGWSYPVDFIGDGSADHFSSGGVGLISIIESSSLSLRIDSVDAEDLNAEEFMSDYFSAQRPVLITGQLTAGAGIWAHWAKEDFLARYGAMKVAMGPGEFAETHAALKYNRLVSANASVCESTDRTSKKSCKASRRSTYKKTLSVNEYVSRCLSASLPPESTAPMTTPRCSWDGHAAQASAQFPEEWRWDLPVPELFDALCRRPRNEEGTEGFVDSSISSLHSGVSATRRHLHAAHDVDEPVQLHLGGKYSGLPLQAHNASWNLLLVGKKKWFLLPPGAVANSSQEQFMCEDESSIPSSATPGKIDGKRIPTACIPTAQEWLLAAVPRLRERRVLVEVTQYQGDVLFIPHDWQYATLNLADTVSISKEMCTLRNSDARVHPLGSVIYGREDPHRGIGLFQRHRKSSSTVGIKLKATSKVPHFDFQPVT